MATYERKLLPFDMNEVAPPLTDYVGNGNPSFADRLVLTDHTLYGSARLGITDSDKLIAAIPYSGPLTYNASGYITNTPGTVITATVVANSNTLRRLQQKTYELSNHMGNVLNTVTDRKLVKLEQIENYPLINSADGWQAIGASITTSNTGLNVVPNSNWGGIFQEYYNLQVGVTYTFTINLSYANANNIIDCGIYQAPWNGVVLYDQILKPGLNTITITPTVGDIGVKIQTLNYTSQVQSQFKVTNITFNNATFAPQVTNATDYYAFGAPTPGRQFSSLSYRFGFNGKENDNEVKGVQGSQQDYGMRIYDPRIGKFLSVDPLFKSFPWNSCYAFAENTPIAFIDLDGEERYHFMKTFINGTPVYTLVGIEDLVEKTYSVEWHGTVPEFVYTTHKNERKEFVIHMERDATIERFDKVEFVTLDETTTYTTYEKMIKNEDGESGHEFFWHYFKKAMQAVHEENVLAGGGAGLNYGKAVRWSRFSNEAANTGSLVKIGVVEGDVMMFSSKIGTETVEGITNFAVKDGKLYLNQLHLQGSSAGAVGRESLWNMAKDLGKQYNVKEVIIQGGKRTTGKYKGTVPSPITIKVD